jgi:predicted MFS family arabinose efflux permease
MVSGVRYIVHSPPIRIVLYRTLVTGIAGGSVLALLPLVARDILHGGAQTYGIMLGCFGIGGVLGALNISSVRTYLSSERAVRLCALTMGLAICVLALSRSPALTGAGLVVAGASWMIAVTLFNIGVQLDAAMGRGPRARGLSGRDRRRRRDRKLALGLCGQRRRPQQRPADCRREHVRLADSGDLVPHAFHR